MMKLLFGVFLFLSSVCAAQVDSAHHPNAPKAAFGWVNLQVHQHVSTPKEHLDSAPYVIVKFTSKGVTTFAGTNEIGVAAVPLPYGHYCASAFGTDGKLIALDISRAGQPNLCFDVHPAEWSEIHLVLMAGTAYMQKIPEAGIE